MLVWDRYGFHKKHAGTHYAKLVFLHLIGSTGDILHSTVSGAQNVDALFLMLVWDCTDSTKSALGYITPNLSFCIQ
jgi:hypothetical protein